MNKKKKQVLPEFQTCADVAAANPFEQGDFVFLNSDEQAMTVISVKVQT